MFVLILSGIGDRDMAGHKKNKETNNQKVAFGVLAVGLLSSILFLLITFEVLLS